jgi:hypothetical protein
MLELPIKIELTIIASGKPVAAELIQLDVQTAKKRIDAEWWSGLGVPTHQRKQEVDHHWNWADELGKHRNQLYYESVAVQSKDGQVQGAMIYRVDAISVLQEGCKAVYVERLAAAPRNRDWPTKPPLYRHVGENLIRWAAYHSIQLGFKGTVNLARVDTDVARGFYRAMNFVETSVEEDGMVICELSPESAAKLVAEDPQLI